MTKLSYILMLFLAISCSKSSSDKPEPVVPERNTIHLRASMEGLKAGVDDSGVITWQSGDKIAVLLDDGSVTSLSLESGAGTRNAVFSGDLPAGRTFAGKAAYPWLDGAWSSSAGELVLTLPEAVTWPAGDYVPAIMKATAVGESLSFTHVGAIMQFTIKA